MSGSSPSIHPTVSAPTVEWFSLMSWITLKRPSARMFAMLLAVESATHTYVLMPIAASRFRFACVWL
jgi:amino acid permease